MFQNIFYVLTLKDPPGVKDTTFDQLKKRYDQISDSDTANNNSYSMSDDIGSASSNDIYSDFNTQPAPSYKLNELRKPNKQEMIAENKKWLGELGSKLNKELDLDKEIASLSDHKAWQKLKEYISDNLKDLLVDGSLAITFHIRYFLCCYIVVFVPGEFSFFYPAAWQRLIPDEVLKINLIRSVINGIKVFQDFVKEKGETTFLVPITVGRVSKLSDDLDFIMKIPVLLFTEPEIILREMLSFDIKSPGFAEFREKNSFVKSI